MLFFDLDIIDRIEGGELFDRVIEEDYELTEKACTVFVRQICEAVDFLQSRNVLHLDLKPENVLCLSREGNRIKIIDFGMARIYDSTKKLQVLFGTPEFVGKLSVSSVAVFVYYKMHKMIIFSFLSFFVFVSSFFGCFIFVLCQSTGDCQFRGDKFLHGYVEYWRYMLCIGVGYVAIHGRN